MNKPLPKFQTQVSKHELPSRDKYFRLPEWQRIGKSELPNEQKVHILIQTPWILLQYQPASALCLRLHHIFKTIFALFGRFGKDLLMFTNQDWTFLFLCGLSFYPSPCRAREIMIPVNTKGDNFTLLASFQLSGFTSFFLLFLRWETPQSEKQTRRETWLKSHK